MATSSRTAASFLWGAATALSLVYVYTAVQQKRRKRSAIILQERHHQQAPIVSRNSSVPESQHRRPLLDRPDLDLRLIRKAEAVIRGRTDKIVIVVERCTNDHNYSAILRTAEALGIQTVCIIDPPALTVVEQDGSVQVADDEEELYTDNNRKSMPVVRLSQAEKRAFEDHRKFAQNATEWLTIREFGTATECISALRNEGYHVWVTDLSQQAVPLTETDLQAEHQWPMPDKVALVVGTEAVGCSQEMLLGGDLRVYLPLAGFADSLNLSVATALVIQQLFHLQPAYVGSMSEANRHILRQQWFPQLAQQRLLSSRGKKQRRAIMKQIQIGERLKARQQLASGDGEQQLDAEQQRKIAALPEHRRELRELEAAASFGLAADAVADLVAHPPEPLTDLRRADPHRVTFVGKNTKRLHAEHWRDLVATTNTATAPNATAAFFRDRVAGGGGGGRGGAT